MDDNIVVAVILGLENGSIDANSNSSMGYNIQQNDQRCTVCRAPIVISEGTGTSTRAGTMRAMISDVTNSCGSYTMIGNKNLEEIRAIVADDDNLSRKVMKKMVQRYICEDVTTVEDGTEVVELVEDSRSQGDGEYELIFLDCEMKFMGGVEATEMLRESGYRGVIVLVTGHVVEDVESGFIQAGGNLVVCKPVRKEDFDCVVDICQKLIT